MSVAVVIFACVAYVALLFLVAWYADLRSSQGRSLVNNPYIYSLSLAVYCTAWTYFGSVGRAATSGFGFLPIYLGPTIMMPLWVIVIRKIILISKSQRINSVADFISSRYGKSTSLGVLATLIAVCSIIPYISIQLKAVASCFEIMAVHSPDASILTHNPPVLLDSSFYISIALAIFTVLFGTRNLDPNERHEGLVAAIAFESVLKLVAFLTVGVFVTFGIFNGFGDLFSKGMASPQIANILSLEGSGLNAWSWFWLTLLSMFAIILLPRQFHIAVVENTNPNFTAQAAWIFPLYLLLINIFVLPIAVGGLLQFPLGTVDPDTFVLSLPLAHGQDLLALFVAIGGFSAATSMVIVATIALSIMVSNNLVMPLLLQSKRLKEPFRGDVSRTLLQVRRVSIVAVLLLAYAYFKSVSLSQTLVSIGLISFVGVAQFAPAVFAGLYWKRGTKAGAMAGLAVGFVIWAITLPLPTLAEAGVLPMQIVENGWFNLDFLKPYNLFGMEGMDKISHGAFWSLLFNFVTFVGVSLNTRLDANELTQADLFVDIFKHQSNPGEYEVMRREAKMRDIQILLNRFLGAERAEVVLSKYEADNNVNLSKLTVANADLVNYAETNLAGALGAASAKVILDSVVKEDPISLEEMFKILEQTQEIFQYSRALEEKSKELEETTQQLQLANEQLQEVDKLKENFITTITHELRTPLTSIKSLAKILEDYPTLPDAKRAEFLGIIVGESERVTRLINEVLELSKLQSAAEKWLPEPLDPAEVVESASHALHQLMKEKKIAFTIQLPENKLLVHGVKDRLMQVVVNLISNAVKFCPPKGGKIEVQLYQTGNHALLSVRDNGIGIEPRNHELIFEKFAQVSDPRLGKPQGSGLGLAICREIVERHGGKIRVVSEAGEGATFLVALPLSSNGN